MLAEKDNCCGCSACAAICPKNAIEMYSDAEGFFYPKIDAEACVNCMKCEKVCPVINFSNYHKREELSVCYSGYIEDSAELKSCASGGAATVISRLAVRNDFFVFGCRYSDDFTYAYYECAKNEDMIHKFKSSKYFQSRKGNVFRQIKKLLNESQNVLFIGLPCDVAGLISFLEKDYDNLYTVDLICHGATSEKVNEQFVRMKEKEYGSKVVYLNVREKCEGWVPPYLFIRFENGEVFSKPFYNTEYGVAFAEFSRKYCYKCTFKGNQRPSDITIGDYWGLKEGEEGWNSDGVSILFVHSKKGEKLIKALEHFSIITQEMKKAQEHNPCYLQPRKSTGRRERYAKHFINYGLAYACKHKMNMKDYIYLILANLYHKVFKTQK